MTKLQRYLAEEIAQDHVDGLMTRREALRRLALLGLGAVASSALIAACSSKKPAAAPSPSGSSPSPSPTPTPTVVQTEAITFAGPSARKLMGAWAPSPSPRGGVLVIHDNGGLSDHTRSVAGRFAASGYAALAIDLLSEEGGSDTVNDTASALGRAGETRLVADMEAGVTELIRRLPGKKVAAVGFCFGGGMVWRLIDAPEARLAAAVPFYGPAPDNPNFSGAKAAVLGIYAGLDDRVNASQDEIKAALVKAKLTHNIVTYPGVQHGFFRDDGDRYDATAAERAYAAVLTWFGKYVN